MDEHIVNVSKEIHAGYYSWEEIIYLETKDGKDYEDIFSKYVGKNIKLTIEEI